LKSLNVAGGIILVVSVFTFEGFPISFDGIFSSIGLAYIGLLMITGLSFGLSRLNQSDADAFAVALTLLAFGIIAFIAMTDAGQFGSL